ncbi:hypothetical protein [Collimonas arenae]|uniref:hypothetical protein n=1 Tax=Collimonas arenae TaxID=279058 RepID=UPI00057035E2|nr:hypothetical protein [Collimonas arenae]
MKDLDKLDLVLIGLDFIYHYRYLTWTIAIGSMTWIFIRKFMGIVNFYKISTILWWITIFMAAVEIISLASWFLFFEKDDLGAAFYVGFLGSLPIIIPSFLFLFFKPSQ